jgi:uncharacterized protein (TIGR00297 family)
MGEVLAAVVSSGLALVAWRAGALTLEGAFAAAVVGYAVLFGTGWGGAAMLAAFFVPSTLLGRIAVARNKAVDPADERRTARQVIANGGAAAVGALLEISAPGLGIWIVCGALSAASADTWATSLGAFSAAPPRHLMTRLPVPRGTSGGVSSLGTLAALGGSAAVAVFGVLAGGGIPILVWGMTIGFGGMLLDSLLGATVQGRFECPRCGVATEHRRHRCGSPSRAVGGRRWLDNDGVNALSTTVAALAAAGAWWASAR